MRLKIRFLNYAGGALVRKEILFIKGRSIGLLINVMNVIPSLEG
jgi:hypothetical protein